MPLVLAGATSGSTTIQATDAVTQTITLPNATGTVITTGNIPTGSVLQVVNATYATGVTSTVSSYADTGLTATITPTSSSNKILIIADIEGVYTSGSSNTVSNFQLVRNGTSLYVYGAAGNGATPTLTIITGACSINYLDSPATTSAVTYKIQISNKYASGTVGCTQFGVISTMTLIEVKG